MTVQELESRLAKAKKEELNAKWNKVLEKYNKLGKFLKGKDIIHHHTNYSWSVTRIIDYKQEYYGDLSGAYGQWDKRRWCVLMGNTYHMSSMSWKKSYCTNGDIDPGEWISGFSNVNIDVYDLGIPLKPKEKHTSAWSRFLEIGEINFTRILLSIGKNEYCNKDANQAEYNLSQFLTYLRLVPSNLWDECHEHYQKRLKLAHELYKKYPNGKSIKCEAIDFNKIL